MQQDLLAHFEFEVSGFLGFPETLLPNLEGVEVQGFILDFRGGELQLAETLQALPSLGR